MTTDDQIIVLRTIKHAEGSLVIQCYSRASGRISVYGAGIGKRGSRGGAQLFHPMSILDVTLFRKSGNSMPSIKEVRPAVPLTSIRSSVTKGCITLFMSELFLKCVPQQEADQAVYDHLSTMVQILESSTESVANFPAMFILHICTITGFSIRDNYRPGGEEVFNLSSGSFVERGGGRIGEILLPLEESRLLASLAASDFSTMHLIRSSGRVRKGLINGLVEFISMHLGYEIELKSIEVASSVLEPLFV